MNSMKRKANTMARATVFQPPWILLRWARVESVTVSGWCTFKKHALKVNAGQLNCGGSKSIWMVGRRDRLMLLCLQPRTSQDGAFSSHFSKRTHKGYPQKIVCNAQLGNRWAQRGGEGMLLEASMLVLRSFVFWLRACASRGSSLCCSLHCSPAFRCTRCVSSCTCRVDSAVAAIGAFKVLVALLCTGQTVTFKQHGI